VLVEPPTDSESPILTLVETCYSGRRSTGRHSSLHPLPSPSRSLDPAPSQRSHRRPKKDRYLHILLQNYSCRTLQRREEQEVWLGNLRRDLLRVSRRTGRTRMRVGWRKEVPGRGYPTEGMLEMRTVRQQVINQVRLILDLKVHV
jgi:hypothetical protein